VTDNHKGISKNTIDELACRQAGLSDFLNPEFTVVKEEFENPRYVVYGVFRDAHK
jgi:hypothetical protein